MNELRLILVSAGSSTTLESDGLIDLEEFKKTYYTSPVKTSAKKKFDITQLRKQKVLPGGRYMLTSQELRSESIVEGVQIVAVDFGEVTLEVSLLSLFKRSISLFIGI